MVLLEGVKTTRSCTLRPWSFSSWASLWAHLISGKRTFENVLSFSRLTCSQSGAGTSKGKTSWTGKPETNDYISFGGFLLHYLNNLQPPKLSSAPDQLHMKSETGPSPIQSSEETPAQSHINVDEGMIIVLGGYSYGSLITTLLPTTDVILSRFANATKGGAVAEIISRAADLSDQWNKEARHDCEARRGRQLMMGQSVRASSHIMAEGGEGCEHGNRKASGASRRSLDGLRRSLDVSEGKLSSRDGSRGDDDLRFRKDGILPGDIQLPNTSYLLISPLLPPVSTLATMFSNSGVTEGPEEIPSSQQLSTDTILKREKFLSNNTLAIYGDKDFFTSQRKLRRWAEHLAGESNSKFWFREISGAGHFWVEDGVEEQLRAAVREWVQNIVSGDPIGQSV